MPLRPARSRRRIDPMQSGDPGEDVDPSQLYTPLAQTQQTADVIRQSQARDVMRQTAVDDRGQAQQDNQDQRLQIAAQKDQERQQAQADKVAQTQKDQALAQQKQDFETKQRAEDSRLQGINAQIERTPVQMPWGTAIQVKQAQTDERRGQPLYKTGNVTTVDPTTGGTFKGTRDSLGRENYPAQTEEQQKETKEQETAQRELDRRGLADQKSTLSDMARDIRAGGATTQQQHDDLKSQIDAQEAQQLQDLQEKANPQLKTDREQKELSALPTEQASKIVNDQAAALSADRDQFEAQTQGLPANDPQVISGRQKLAARYKDLKAKSDVIGNTEMNKGLLTNNGTAQTQALPTANAPVPSIDSEVTAAKAGVPELQPAPKTWNPADPQSTDTISKTSPDPYLRTVFAGQGLPFNSETGEPTPDSRTPDQIADDNQKASFRIPLSTKTDPTLKDRAEGVVSSSGKILKNIAALSPMSMEYRAAGGDGPEMSSPQEIVDASGKTLVPDDTTPFHVLSSGQVVVNPAAISNSIYGKGTDWRKALQDAQDKGQITPVQRVAAEAAYGQTEEQSRDAAIKNIVNFKPQIPQELRDEVLQKFGDQIRNPDGKVMMDGRPVDDRWVKDGQGLWATTPAVQQYLAEKMLTSPTSGMDAVRESIDQGVRGAVGMATSTLRAPGEAARAGLNSNFGQYLTGGAYDANGMGGWTDPLKKLADSVDDHLQTYLPTDEKQANNWYSQLAQGAGSMVGFAGGGELGAVRMGAAKMLGIRLSERAAATIGTAALGGATNMDQVLTEAKQKGLAPEDEWKVGALGFGIGASEALPIEHAISKIADPLLKKSAGRALSKVFMSGLESSAEEGTQELFQGLTNNLVAQKFYDKNAGSLDTVFSQAGVGGATGLIMGLLAGGIRRRNLGKIQQKLAAGEYGLPATPTHADVDAAMQWMPEEGFKTLDEFAPYVAAAQEISGIEKSTPEATQKAQDVVSAALKSAQGIPLSAVEQATLLNATVPSGIDPKTGQPNLVPMAKQKGDSIELTPEGVIRMNQAVPESTKLFEQMRIRQAAQVKEEEAKAAAKGTKTEAAPKPATEANATSPAGQKSFSFQFADVDGEHVGQGSTQEEALAELKGRVPDLKNEVVSKSKEIKVTPARKVDEKASKQEANPEPSSVNESKKVVDEAARAPSSNESTKTEPTKPGTEQSSGKPPVTPATEKPVEQKKAEPEPIKETAEPVKSEPTKRQRALAKILTNKGISEEHALAVAQDFDEANPDLSLNNAREPLFEHFRKAGGQFKGESTAANYSTDPEYYRKSGFTEEQVAESVKNAKAQREADDAAVDQANAGVAEALTKKQADKQAKPEQAKTSEGKGTQQNPVPEASEKGGNNQGSQRNEPQTSETGTGVGSDVRNAQRSGHPEPGSSAGNPKSRSRSEQVRGAIGSARAWVDRLNKSQKLSRGKGIKLILSKSGQNPTAHMQADGTVTLTIDPDHAEGGIETRDKLGGSGETWLNQVIGEEITHAADLLAARKKWEAAGSKGNALEFWKTERRKDIGELRKSLSGPNGETIANAIVKGFLTYDSAGRPLTDEQFKKLYDDLKGSTPIEKATNLLNDSMNGVPMVFQKNKDGTARVIFDTNIAAEVLRQMVQARHDGEITESGFHAAMGRIIQWLKDTVDWLKAAGDTPEIKAILADIQGILDAADNFTEPPKRKVQLPHAPTGVSDLLDFISEHGGILNRDKASTAAENAGRTLGAEYDGFDPAAIQGIYRATLLNGKIPADVLAQQAFDQGLIASPDPDDLWKGISQAIQSRNTQREEEKANQVEQKKAQGVSDRFQKAIANPEKNIRQKVDDLKVGDSIKVEGEQLDVTEIDPDSGDVTLEGSHKWGTQTLPSGKIIFVTSKKSAPEPQFSEDEAFAAGIDALFSGDVPENYAKDIRFWIPKWRGQITQDKIKKYLKTDRIGKTRSGNTDGRRILRKFKSPEELAANTFWHGTGGSVWKGIAPSITMSDREIERIGGGGYGEKYWGVSVSEDKNAASNFTGQSRFGNVYPVILLPGAKVKVMPEIQDAAELEDHIVQLWEEGVDAVKIGDRTKSDGEMETVIIHPRAAWKGPGESYPVFNKARMSQPTPSELWAWRNKWLADNPKPLPTRPIGEPVTQEDQLFAGDLPPENKNLEPMLKAWGVRYDGHADLGGQTMHSLTDIKPGSPSERGSMTIVGDLTPKKVKDSLDALRERFAKNPPYEKEQKKSGTTGQKENSKGAMEVFSGANGIDGKTEKVSGITSRIRGHSDKLLAADIEPGFYSELSRAIEQKMPVKASVQQVMGIVKGSQSIKPEELKWSNLEGFLDGKQTVTKQEVLDYLANEGAVKFEEVDSSKTPGLEWVQDGKDFKAKGPDGRTEFRAEYMPSNQMYRISPPIGGIRGYKDIGEVKETVESTWGSMHPPHEATKYSQYQLPGGSNYREVVLTLPQSSVEKLQKEKSDIQDNIRSKKLSPEAQAAKDAHAKASEEYLTNFSENSSDKRDAAQSKMVALYDKEFAKEYRRMDEIDELLKGDGSSFTSGHFENIPNYIAHMRLNEREDSSGNPGLFIEEAQSDLHQRGRSKGYKFDLKTFPEGWIVKHEPDPNFPGRPYVVYDNSGKAITVGATEEQAKENAISYAEDSAGERVNDAPFRKDWPVQLFKRSLRDAVASGKEWVGWTDGATQSDRYDLSKQVKELNIVPMKATGDYLIRGRKVGSTSEAWDIDRHATAEELPEVVGKDIAKKAIEDGETHFEGEGLRVGNLGMQGFYDTILPKEIGKYVKKLDKNAVVEKGSIPIPEHTHYPTININENEDGTVTSNSDAAAQQKDASTTPIWQVKITDALRQSVLDGQPLFAADITDNPKFEKWFGDSKVVDENGKPLVVYHGTNSRFRKFNLKKTTQGLIWITSDKSKIEKQESGAQGSKIIMPLYAKITNPAGWSEYDKYGLYELKRMGYDGVILRDKDGTFDAFVFDPNQVKSAIGNSGEFSPVDDNISRSSDIDTNTEPFKDPEGSINAILKENGADPIPTDELQRARFKVDSETDGTRTAGRPDLSIPRDNPELQKDFMTADEARLNREDRQTFEQWTHRAREELKKDYAGLRRRLITIGGQEGGILDAWETIAAQMIIEREEAGLVANADRSELQKLIWAYRNTGSEAARSLTSRRAWSMTPEQRAKMWLRESIFTPPDLYPALKKAQKDGKQIEVKRLQKQLEERVKNIEKGLSRWGLSIDDLFSDKFKLVLKSAAIINEKLKGLDGPRKQALRLLQDGNFDHAEIAAKTGLTRNAVAKLQDEIRAQVRKDLLAKVKAGATVENIDVSVPEDALRAADISGEDDLTPAQEAEMNRILDAMGLRTSEEHHEHVEKKKRQAKVFKNKPRKRIITPGASTETEKTTPEEGGFDPANKFHQARVMQIVSSEWGKFFDKLQEFYINSILSGPLTHATNILGNTANLIWDSSIQRAMEASVNSMLGVAGMGSKDAAKFGELKHLWKGLAPSMGKAYELARQAWSTEQDFSEHHMLNKPLQFDGDGNLVEGDGSDKQGPGKRQAIGGKTGRIVRIPGRALMFADVFTKLIAGRMNAGAFAYRQALKEGLTGKSLENRVDWLVSNPGSSAWQQAYEKALDLSFQADLPKWVNKISNSVRIPSKNAGDGERAFKLAMTVFFPFVKTPWNIASTGIRKSPLGSIGFLSKAAYAASFGLKNKNDFNAAFGEKYSGGEFIRDFTEQIIAFGLTALLYGAFEGDKDDDDKKLLITGGRPYGVDKQGQSDILDRTSGGQYTMRIGGRNGIHFNYGRLDPLATFGGLITDMVRLKKAVRDGGSARNSINYFGSSLLSQFRDKTFLQGFGELAKLLNGDQDLGDFATNTVLGPVIPNFIKQITGATDDSVRMGGQNIPYQLTRYGGLAPKAFDPYGNPIEKGGNMLSRIFLPPAKKVQPENEKMDELLDRYNRTAGTKWAPERLTKDVTVNKKSIDLTQEELSKASEIAGAAFKTYAAGYAAGRESLTDTDIANIKAARSRMMIAAKLKVIKERATQ